MVALQWAQALQQTFVRSPDFRKLLDAVFPACPLIACVSASTHALVDIATGDGATHGNGLLFVELPSIRVLRMLAAQAGQRH